MRQLKPLKFCLPPAPCRGFFVALRALSGKRVLLKSGNAPLAFLRRFRRIEWPPLKVPKNSIVEIEMKKIPFLALALLTGVFAIPAHAQDAMKKEAAIKPADPELKVVLDSWNDVGRKLIAMAEDFPEDKYDFKPTPAQRSFAEQLLHAAGSTYYFTNPVMGQKPPAGEDPKRDQYKTRADVVAFVTKSVAA